MALQTTHLAWRSLATRFTERHASSFWRLPVLVLVLLGIAFGPLYLLRGMRLVQLAGFGLVASIAAAYFFTQPFRGLVVAILVLFSGLDAYLPGPAGIALLAVALARIVFDALDGEPIDWGRPLFRIALTALLLLALTSLLVVRRLDLVLVEVRNIVIGLCLFVTLSQLARSAGRVATVTLAFGGAQAVASLLVLRGLLAAGPGALALTFATRFGGLGIDPNIHAGNLDATLPILFASMGVLSGWRRWALPPVILIAIASVILSQSRAGVLLLGLVVLVSLLRAGRRGRFVLVLSLAGLAALALALPRGYWIRFESIGQLSGIVVDRSLLLRQHAYAVAVAVFRDNWLLGVGLGNFRMEAPRHMLGEMLAHNSFLEVAASLGLFGLAAYLGCLFASLGATWQATRIAKRLGLEADARLAQGMGLSILAFCAMAMTLSMPFSPILWLLLGLANAMRGSLVTAPATPAQRSCDATLGGPTGPPSPGA